MRAPLSLLCASTLVLVGCPTGPADDDDTTVAVDDDDDVTADDDDDATTDDDDVTADDDDTTPPPCEDDHLEDNDSFETAHEVAFGDDLEDLQACPGDDDWFFADIPTNSWLFVDTYFEHAGGNVDLELYDEAGVLVDTSDSVDDDERVGFFLPDGGIYSARVILGEGDDDVIGGTYELSPGVCRPDWYEPNEVSDDATPFSGNWSEFDLTICGESIQDWYVLTDVAPPQVIDVRLIFLGRDGDLDMSLFGPSGDLIAVGLNEFPVETLLHTVAEPGDYTVQVLLDPDLRTPGHKYDMDINVDQNPGGCFPDIFEPNDTEDDAIPIAPTIYEDFTACEDDDDWVEFTALAGDTIELTVDFFDAEGNIDLFLYDSSGAEVAFADSTDDDEFISYPVLADDTFYARVSLTANDGGFPGNYYGLVLSGVTSSCIDDVFEPNNSPEEALPMPNGDYRDETICMGDDDWYELSLNWLELVVIDVGYYLDEGNVDGFLMDSDLNIVASGTNPIYHDHFEWLVVETGTYYLQVTQVEDVGVIEGNIYDFGILSIISTACSPDIFEPNNTIDTAIALNTGPQYGLTVCEFEPDFFLFEGAPGDIEITALFDHDDGNIDLRLYDPGGSVVATADSTDDDEELLYDASGDPGDYVLEVFVSSGGGPDLLSSYELDLQF